MTGCRLTTPRVDDSTNDSSLRMDEPSLADSSIEDSDDSSADSSNGSLGQADNLPWKSPMSDYVPKSPFSKYIEFVKGEITTERNDKRFSDYISGNYKYVCCDISGDGVQELIVSFFIDDKEELIVFGYNSEEDTIIVDLNQDINRLPSQRI